MARILIVEDERIVAFGLKQRLLSLGHDVSGIASSCAEVLASIEEQAPDLILMDIHLEGGIDGIDTALRIPKDLLIPVIYVTAHAEESTLKRAAETKPYGYLVKPFSARELSATIQMAFERHATEMALMASQAELSRSRENFRDLFIRNPVPMWVFDVATLAFLDVNDAALSAYGYSRDEMRRMTIAQIRPREDAAGLSDYLRPDTPAYLSARNVRHLKKSGEIFEIDGFSYPLRFEGRDARMVVAVDVTARNRAEEKLRQAQRMEAIGHLTGGVAHDFNNLLAVIYANLEFLVDELKHSPALLRMVSDALNAARRGATLTDRLLAFSRQQALEPTTVSLKLLLSNLLALLRRTVDETVHIQLEVASDIWPVFVDANQLENAVVNLVVNARDAMPGGGALTIEAFNKTIGDADAELGPELNPGEYVVVVVTDTGIGMKAEVVQRAFDPFFTTKPVGKGTGLGLSMVLGFIQQSGGHARIHSEVGKGTSVRLYLPRAQRIVEPKRPEPVQEIGSTWRGRVLVVEDDEAVRRAATAMLERLGYRTLQASDGPTALDMVDDNADIDILLSDVVLPNGLSGPELAAAIKLRMPKIRTVFMSGYTRDTMIHNGMLSTGVHLLMKPFTLADLRIKLAEVLEDGHALD